MASSVNHMELFDAYLNNSMSVQERDSFEGEMAANPALKLEFESHKKFMNDLRDGAEYAEIRNELRQIHNKPGVGNKNFFLTPAFYIPLSLVAVIALLVTIINPFVKEGNEAMSADIQSEKYQSAPTESATESAADTSFYEMPDESLDKRALAELEPGYIDGSSGRIISNAFLISPGGYFLTADLIPADQNVVSLTGANGKTFQAAVIYRDLLMGFAVLQCHASVVASFDSIPFKSYNGKRDAVEQVFAIGFVTDRLKYVKGNVVPVLTNSNQDTASFETDFKMDSDFAGTPVFTEDGYLIGMILAMKNNTRPVTYVLDVHYMGIKLDYLNQQDPDMTMETNYHTKAQTPEEFLQAFKQFIFEVKL